MGYADRDLAQASIMIINWWICREKTGPKDLMHEDVLVRVRTRVNELLINRYSG